MFFFGSPQSSRAPRLPTRSTAWGGVAAALLLPKVAICETESKRKQESEDHEVSSMAEHRGRAECHWGLFFFEETTSRSSVDLFSFLFFFDSGRGQNWRFFFFWPRPPPKGGALMPAPSRSRSWTLSSLQLVHRGDHARSTQQCVAQSELATDLCRWQQEQRGELTSIWKRANCDPASKSHSEIAYCCEAY